MFLCAVAWVWSLAEDYTSVKKRHRMHPRLPMSMLELYARADNFPLRRDRPESHRDRGGDRECGFGLIVSHRRN